MVRSLVRAAFVLAATVTLSVMLASPSLALQGATPDTALLFKGLQLEDQGKYRDAVTAYRAALKGNDRVTALLGLERAYSALGALAQFLGPLDTMIAAEPKQVVYRTAQLRTLQTLGREADLRRAFETWVHDVPNDPAPYREYARILMDRNQVSAADTVIRQAGRVLGSVKELGTEVAQVRASMGDWIESATAWRDALTRQPGYAEAAAYSLLAAPSAQRAAIQQIFLAPPVDPAARRAVAALDAGWGATGDGWIALRDLPHDSTSIEAWTDFADRAESAQQWSLARDALIAAVHVRPSRELALRAATDALNSGDAVAALELLPLASAGTDSATIAREYVPLLARALAATGRPADAQRVVATFDRWLTPQLHDALTRTIALGWVRQGDLPHARDALLASGPDADSSDTAGWLALYGGDLATARVLLRNGTEATPELALALATVARVKADSAPAIGQAFLALARRDSSAAATRFTEAALQTPEVASLMLATAALIRSQLHDDPGAIVIWTRILDQLANTPEAPQAELEWARALLRRGDHPGAIARLEHLILTYPDSALVPQARRELDIARKAVSGVV